MKTVAKNISLPKDLADFAAEEAERGYGSLSAYFAELLRERRSASEAALAEEFRKLSAEGVAGPAPVSKIVSTVRRVRKQLRRERFETKRAA
jgi:predicted ATP-dependent Lon-type protease